MRSDAYDGAEVDFVAEEVGEVVLDVEDLPPWSVSRFELDQHVDVAVRAEIVAQHGTEEGQPSDVVPTAERRERSGIDVDSRWGTRCILFTEFQCRRGVEVDTTAIPSLVARAMPSFLRSPEAPHISPRAVRT